MTLPIDRIARPGKPYGNDLYDADYYLHGKESGKSLYTDYHWMPELTLPMCRRIVDHCGIRQGESILDFGCARGYVVRALQQLGHDAEGIDISSWAIENCDPAVRGYVSCRAAPCREYDWVLAKDVLEHLSDGDLQTTLLRFGEVVRRGLFVVVPLSDRPGEPYVVPEYERDVTHVQRMGLLQWVSVLNYYLGNRWSTKHDWHWVIRGQYRVEGIKDNWSHYPTGNGFLLALRKEGD